jgi:hypothetical protein
VTNRFCDISRPDSLIKVVTENSLAIQRYMELTAKTKLKVSSILLLKSTLVSSRYVKLIIIYKLVILLANEKRRYESTLH